MKDFVPEIEKRRAYRAISANPIPDDVLNRIMEAAVIAPSCANNQPWRFVVVKEAAVLEQVKDNLSSGNYWAKTAPAIVAVCTREDLDAQLSAGRNYAFFDTGMAVANLLLQGVREGLHTHPVAGFNPLPIKEILKIPEDVVLLTLVILGYPGEVSILSEKHMAAESAARERKPFDETVSSDRWQESWTS